MLTRMLVLWLLSEAPTYGYRVKKILEDPALRFWFPVEYASIYSMLRSLVREGHARVVRMDRQGKRPKRTLYRITPAGRAHYADLLRQAWRTPPSPASPFNLALAAMGDLPDEEIPALRRERIAALNARLQGLHQLTGSAPAVEMVEREQVLLRAEVALLLKYDSREKDEPQPKSD